MSAEAVVLPALQRRPDWPERLAHFLATRMLLPFSWGLNDCALFAADWVADCTGHDPAADLRGSYADELGAGRVLQRHGGLLAIVQARLPAYAAALQAHRGDVVCVEVQHWVGDVAHQRPTLGIVAGNGMWAAPGEAGAVYRPMAEAQHAFAVG